MRILLTGATGFLGHEISRELLRKGHELVICSRKKGAHPEFPFPAKWVQWDSRSELPASALQGVQAIINLAGEGIATRRWSPEQKAKILGSRVECTRRLVEAAAKAPSLKTLVSASAIGYYGDRPSTEQLTESSAPGTGFLSEVCQAWEQEAFRPVPGTENLRRVAIRIGIVLGQQGALQKLVPLFRTGAGGPVGGGKQTMSWIHVEDLARVFVEATSNPAYQGPINAVAPNAVNNKEFSRVLGRTLHRPALLPAPAIALKLALGEMSSVVLDGQRVLPQKLTQLDYQFAYPHIAPALQNLLAPQDPADEQFAAEQWIPKPVGEVFEFFSAAKNLQTITPPFLGFEVQSVSTPEIQAGTLIDYRLKLHGVPLLWRTRIEDWQPGMHFVDTQLKGPYTKWHHTHTFEPLAGGTLMRDRVLYRLPMGALGKGVAHWKVKSDISRIFDYRRQKIRELFG